MNETIDNNDFEGIEVPKEFLVRVDSLLSALVWRNSALMEEIDEIDEATELYLQARKLYEDHDKAQILNDIREGKV